MALAEYLESQYSDTLTPIKELSLSKTREGKEEPLVEHDGAMYNFDMISELFHTNAKDFGSADAIIAHKNTLFLVEFKGGFNRKITQKNYNWKSAKCVFNDSIGCEHHKNYFTKSNDLKIQVLKDSLKLKIIESYITLEKHVFKLANISREDLKMRFICVVDFDGEDNLSLSSTEESDVGNLKKAFSRLKNKTDAVDKKYYYDDIMVLLPQEFTDFLSEKKIPTI